MDFTYAQVSSLNETEACVYNYVMQHKNQVLEESIRELADHVHVSTASVIRFCKKLGCSGFTDFKYKLRESLAIETYEAQIHHSSFGDFTNHVNSKEYLDSIQKAVDFIRNADSLFVLGSGPFSGFAQFASRSFSYIGYYCTDIEDKFYHIPEVPEGQRAVVIATYDKIIEEDLFEELKNYKEKNYVIIMITCNDIGVMEYLCDHIIYASNGYVKMGNIISGIPVQLTFEKIMTGLTE
ncbi:MurR/RpiR family transcriptional regulator [uncultured Catenibacterium sp.]|uniref:MurR/RpiR family transcriptional regulator n=1 Tax=uncultured Catenibacterium sp. TaxID=286142 RepID=UPI0025D1A69E|nr:MurR/RpiR family transcriptional regulator [uncultured Catenibacterium sp.]